MTASPSPDPPPPPAEEVEAPPPVLVYSVNRIAEPIFNTARAVQVITAEDIRRRGARTLPEALMEEAGLFVQQTNYGAGSPIVRGLIGKQVLILLNGVKVNNATYRFGPVQYLSTIDLASVERVEVVRGVGSVLGSDSLGGVINVITRKGPPQPGVRVGAGLESRFSTADRGHTAHGEVYGQGERHRFLVGGTYRGGGSLDGGGATGRQPGSGYDEGAVHASVEYFPSSDRTLSLVYHHLEQDDVSRTDRLVTGTSLLFAFDPQRLQALTVGYQDLTHRGWADSLRLTAYWNRQHEEQHEIRASSPTLRTDLSDRQDMAGLNAEISWFPAGSHRLLYGVDATWEEIRSSRSDHNLATGQVRQRRGTWTDGAGYSTLAAYVQDRFDLGTLLTVTLGARYARFASSGREDSAVGVLDLESTVSDVTGSVSAVVHAGPHVNVVGSVVRGFRAPNLDDISVLNERADGTEVPNPDIQAERILAYEAGLKFSSARLEGSAFLYHSRMRDLLVRAPGTFEGLPFFDLNGNGLADAREPAVLQRRNLGRATIQGVELDARWRPHPRLTLFGTFTHTRGDDTVEDVPLARIPPAFGTAGARWCGTAAAQPWAEVVLVFAGAQRRLAPADVADARIGPEGTDGFGVVNLRGGVSVGGLRLALGLENLTDEEYKYHGSGLFRPGRQAVLGAELRF